MTKPVEFRDKKFALTEVELDVVLTTVVEYLAQTAAQFFLGLTPYKEVIEVYFNPLNVTEFSVYYLLERLEG